MFGIRSLRHSEDLLPQPDNTIYRYRNGDLLKLQGVGHLSTRFINWETAATALQERLPELYTRRDECCGCTGCVAACPVNAIAMHPDEEGFYYPVIDAMICIGCGRCEHACAYSLRQGRRSSVG